MIKIKLLSSLFLIVGMVSLSGCEIQNDPKPAYIEALETINKRESVLWSIILDGKANHYDNKTVKLYGYINKENSEVHPDDEFLLINRPPSKFIDHVVMYQSYSKKELLKPVDCKGGGELTEIHGTFHIHEANQESEKYYYLTDIKVIYDFDTRPKKEGGGAKYQCYPSKTKKSRE